MSLNCWVPLESEFFEAPSLGCLEIFPSLIENRLRNFETAVRPAVLGSISCSGPLSSCVFHLFQLDQNLAPKFQLAIADLSNGMDRSCAATIYPMLDKPRTTGAFQDRRKIEPLLRPA
jgi:hypothetical protein